MTTIESKNETLITELGDTKVRTIIYTSVGIIGGFAVGYLVGNLIVK